MSPPNIIPKPKAKSTTSTAPRKKVGTREASMSEKDILEYIKRALQNRNNLQILAKEILDWKKNTVLCNGLFRELAEKITQNKVWAPYGYQMLESMVKDACLMVVSTGTVCADNNEKYVAKIRPVLERKPTRTKSKKKERR